MNDDIRWIRCPHCKGRGAHVISLSAVQWVYFVCVWCAGSGAVEEDLVFQYHVMQGIQAQKAMPAQSAMQYRLN